MSVVYNEAPSSVPRANKWQNARSRRAFSLSLWALQRSRVTWYLFWSRFLFVLYSCDMPPKKVAKRKAPAKKGDRPPKRRATGRHPLDHDPIEIIQPSCAINNSMRSMCLVFLGAYSVDRTKYHGSHQNGSLFPRLRSRDPRETKTTMPMLNSSFPRPQSCLPSDKGGRLSTIQTVAMKATLGSLRQ